MVKIVTDTLCDIPFEMADELGISIVPLNLHFGTETYRDKIDITTGEFYQKLVTSEVFPTSSAPPPGIFVELFTKLAKETDEILAIMVSSKLSAICESAIQGKAMVEAKCQIEVIDSRQVIGGQLLLVIMAANAAREGAKLEQISDMVRKAIPRVHMRMAFDTLEYLQRGGRIGKASAFLGGLLKFNPVLGLHDGEIAPIARPRGRAKSTDFLVNFAKEFSKVEGLVVEHASTPDELEALADRLGEIFPRERMLMSEASPVIGVHVGPHVLAVSILEGE
jgi:DegV family protein with EDD domain